MLFQPIARFFFFLTLFVFSFPLASTAQEIRRTLSPTIQIPVVAIEGGKYLMGDTGASDGEAVEQPSHEVIVEPFFLGAFEVTQAQFEAVMGYNPSYNSGPDKPVEQVSWYDAVRFCNQLSRLDGLEPAYRIDPVEGYVLIAGANGYRLPTEEEWEYAARAGTTTDTYAGELSVKEGQEPLLDQIAWYYTGAKGFTRSVGGKEPNALGMHDILGNVWEWTESWFNSYADSTSDKSLKVLRGGAMDAVPYANRASYRYRLHPSYTSYNIGFRIARNMESND